MFTSQLMTLPIAAWKSCWRSKEEPECRESFDGLNALFTLSIDPAKADSEKANEIIQRIDL